MILRLVVEFPGRSDRFRLYEGDNLIGSSRECTICLSDPTVSRRHAVIRVAEGKASLEDLGSRNGTTVGGRRVGGRVAVAAGAQIGLGTLKSRIEEVEEDDLATGKRLVVAPRPNAPERSVEPSGTTVAHGSLRDFVLVHLPGLLARLEREAGVAEMAQAAAAAVHEALSCTSVEVIRGSGPDHGVLFAARRTDSEGHVVEGRRGDLTLRVGFVHATEGELYRPLVDAAVALIGLAAGREPRPGPPAVPGPVPAPPDPPSLDPAVRALYRDAARVAQGEISVLIRGESGTGKELLARYLHAASPRAKKPLIAINCAAIPRELLEAELFGVEQGVATGVSARPGKFELADGGTLFLDEIGDMGAETQAKILRVLQEREVYRLGAREPRPARVRLISATNRDLEDLIQGEHFRRDLLHRVADWTVTLPPLRERPADIPNLAAHFLSREAGRRELRARGISRAALEVMQAFEWPGNIRQLEREMGRAALFLEEGQLLETRHLQEEIRSGGRRSAPRELKEVLEQVERREIERALAECGGDTAAAADRLGIGRSTLYRRMKDLGVGFGPE